MRGTGVNTYGVEGKTYEAFGNDVPPAVSKLLGLAEVNFQGQHDAAFWFGLSPGQLAKELNKIVDLELKCRCRKPLN